MEKYKLPIIIFVLLVILFVISFGIYPLYGDISDLKDNRKEEERILKNKKELINKIEELSGKYKDISDQDKTRLSYVVPDNKDIPNLLVQLEALAAQSGLEMRSISFTSEKGAKAGYNTMGISLRLNGNYEALKRYLQAVEENIRIFDVQSISFTSNDQGLFDYSVKIATYYK